MNLLESALKARQNGISTVVVTLPSKKPPEGISWKERQDTLPDEATIRSELAGGNGNIGLAVIGGKVSRNLAIFDHDLGGVFYNLHVNLVEAEAPGLINRLAVQRTMNNGKHLILRCREAKIQSNKKLARKQVEVSGPGEHVYNGKSFKAQQHQGKWYIYPVAIETRGEGGYAVVCPSPGYTEIQPGENGEFFDFPEVTAKELEILTRNAKVLDEYPPKPVRTSKAQSGGKPGEDFNARGEVLDLLFEDGWKQVGQSENKLHLTRPGKDIGISATLYDGKVLHVFSTNALPFEGDESYSPFAIYTLLKHNGDFSAAASELARQGYGDSSDQLITTVEHRNTIRRFEFIHNADILAALRPIDWQIQDILVKNSFYYDFGDPGSFKTFIAIDRLLCIAAGIDYHGHRVTQGTVFYIAGEGQQGIGRRIAAWHIAHKTNPADIPFFLAKTPTQLMDSIAVDNVRRAVDALSKEYDLPAVLHIDTLARNFGEGDENATKDMNKVIQNMDLAFGNDFCRGITHHTGHMNKGRARGSIALHGAADEAFRASFTAGQQVLVECKKMKDAPSSPAMLFDLNTIPLLIENQKDSSFSLSISAEGDDAMAAAKDYSDTVKVSDNMQKALDLLDQMYAEYEKNLTDSGRSDTMPRVELKDWREACLDKKLYRRRSTFRRALKSLLERNLVFLSENEAHVCTVSIYLKCKEKRLEF